MVQEDFNSYTIGYPFPMVKSGDNTTANLTWLLPSRDEIIDCLNTFQHITQEFAVPYTPDSLARPNVEQFLDNAEYNATKAPDMLALLFAALALVLQAIPINRNHQCAKIAAQARCIRGDCYSKLLPGYCSTVHQR